MRPSLGKHAVRNAVGGLLDHLLTREQRIRLGRYILNRELGEGIGDPSLNGEYTFLRSLADAWTDSRPIVFDVGANVGTWSLTMRDHVPPGGTIYAFEPESSTFDALAARLASAQATPQLVPVRAALSDREGEADLHLAGARAETNSLVFRPGVTHSGSARVPLMRADNFCKLHGIHRVDFAKIDVEGHELSTLRGFEELLRDQRVGCIQFEYGTTWVDSRVFLADAFAYLMGLGYRMGKLMPNGILPISEYAVSLERFAFSNFVAMTPVWAARCQGLMVTTR